MRRLPAGTFLNNRYLVTVNVTEVVRCNAPLVPMIVNVNVPVLLPAVTVNVEPPDPLTDDGLKLAVAPPVSPLTDSATVPANPPSGVTVTTYVVLVLRATVREDGVAESEKSAAPVLVTTSVTVLERTRLPLVPVMVRV